MLVNYLKLCKYKDTFLSSKKFNLKTQTYNLKRALHKHTNVGI